MYVFENEFFCVVDKPSGWLTVPSRQGAKDLRRCLLIEICREKKIKQLWPVHRLDFEVSGLVLFAKNPEAHRAANHWFEDRFVQKTYEALTSGETTMKPGASIEWTSKILRGKKRAYESEHGKQAITKATFVEKKPFKDKEYLFWNLNPLTGRAHQLRFHLVKAGFPILGDKLYGSTDELAENVIALRAVHLDFTKCEDASKFQMPDTVAATGLHEHLKKL